MLLPILLSAAVAPGPPSFGPALADADLSAMTASARPGPVPLAFDLRPAVSPVQEQVDNWWADDGARLLAAARPFPALPTGLDLAALASGPFALRFDLTVTATTP